MESFTEDTLYTITSYLSSKEILNLALTCKYFGGKPGGITTAGKKKTKRRKKNKTTTNNNDDQSSKDRQWSLMEEMAKRRVEKTKRDTNWQEKWQGTDVYKLTSRTGNESWIRVDNRIQKMSSELVFSRFKDRVTYVKRDPSHIQMKRSNEFSATHFASAMCQNIMKEGRHYALFTVTKRGRIRVGIYDVQTEKSWGYGYYGESNALILSAIRPEGTVIGLLLDFQDDTLQIYVDGEIKHQYNNQFVGRQFSWEVSIVYRGAWDLGKGAVKIERGILP